MITLKFLHWCSEVASCMWWYLLKFWSTLVIAGHILAKTCIILIYLIFGWKYTYICLAFSYQLGGFVMLMLNMHFWSFVTFVGCIGQLLEVFVYFLKTAVLTSVQPFVVFVSSIWMQTADNTVKSVKMDPSCELLNGILFICHYQGIRNYCIQ